MTPRAAVVRALEALEDGEAREAEAILRSALRRPARRRHRCPVCGVGFPWPGQLNDHVYHVHPEAT